MAFTLTRELSVFGNKRISLMSCSVDSASGVIDTGLSFVDGFTMAPVSMATAGIGMDRNLGSGATSRPGFIDVGSCATGDSFFLVVYGR